MRRAAAPHFITEKSIRLRLPLLAAQEGRASLSLSESNVRHPKEIVLERIRPRRIEIELARRPAKR